MQGRDDHLEREDGKATELESMRHQGTISKDSQEKLIQEKIADMVITTEDEVDGEAKLQSNEERVTDEEDNQRPTDLELDEASSVRLL